VNLNNNIFQGDSLEILKTFPDASVDCCVTSPPYYGLRDYGKAGQIGLEDTPESFIAKLVSVFQEVYRVLKPEATLWLNIGDSYASTGKNRTEEQAAASSILAGGKTNQAQILKQKSKITGDLKQKDLIGIPWMLAFALRSEGWYLRQDIIWHKPNPMPESVTDRCTKAHEYIFLLSKSKRYYFDAEVIKTVAKNPADDLRRLKAQTWDNKNTPDTLRNGIRPKSGNKSRKTGSERGCPADTGSNVCGSVPWEGEKANKRSVWTVNTKPYKEAHFATFPVELIKDCVLAGCPVGGLVLDPFMGAGTTALVAYMQQRNYVGIELNPAYVQIANDRLENYWLS